MGSEFDSIGTDRSGGTSRGSGNPPDGESGADGALKPSALSFPDDELMERLARCGFADAMTGEADFPFSHASFEHMHPYLSVIKEHPAGAAPRVQDAHRLMLFDRKVKAILFEHIGVFETKLRAQYAKQMAGRHGPLCVYDPANYLRRANHEQSLRRYRDEVSRKAKKGKGRFAQAVSGLGGKCPVQLGVECITLGTLSKLYANTADKAATSEIAASFGTSKAVLSNWMRAICSARNAIAHFDAFTVMRELPMKPKPIRGVEARNTAPFYTALLLVSLLSTEHPFADRSLSYAETLAHDLDAVLAEWEPAFGYLYPVLGIPEDWRAAMQGAAGSGALFPVGGRGGAA